MNAIDYKIKGIKCDNPSCDFRDETAKFEEYHLWLNMPCPKCGQNLLTEEDLWTIKFIIQLADVINCIMRPFAFLFKNSKKIKVSANMDGTGKVFFKKVD